LESTLIKFPSSNIFIFVNWYPKNQHLKRKYCSSKKKKYCSFFEKK